VGCSADALPFILATGFLRQAIKMRNQKKYPVRPQDKALGIGSAIIFLVSLIMGGMVTESHDVRVVCAIVCAISLTTTMVMVFKDYEKNGGSDDENPGPPFGK